ncbi:phosphatase PAP2 family protein [Variovorax sp. NFACC27]|uniref:phosphatase PAP2 family protein n=1 Tax=unclassified Variovorax TaxID=663243 RepID=UPI00089B4BF4|nr:Membrane-associated enzyme, PAP2 (acid phosphatase) superfamily [Variovorax sp. NFACC28]SEG91390.1 Membrane-associated enzyme, PAP2 (acid phosphatase) superfamily [Variovorax sp. NFACC29]SFD49435.1 Membrane-associated enzyme, PAP2 (acid phosphatase) superfamily [Variovorax sp. NFACC26]SFG72736.1 Membrane-associated enzyme, PAP2 (acid phosphatase) superfamily [Variovorax sp. NFACC27]
MTRFPNLRLGVFTLAALIALMAWDATGADLLLARMAGSHLGFPLRDNPFMVHVMHEGARNLSWALVILLFAAIRWPFGLLRRLDTGARVQLALTVLGSVIAVSILKHASHTSCPWDLQEFGGVARYVSHWSWGIGDGGPGGCFPAGHASAAFAYVGGYFVLRRVSSRAAAIWLWTAVAAGLVLGVAQQLRGAHYMSHTLWTAWVCWTVGFAIEVAVSRFGSHSSRPAVPAHAGS